MTGAADYRYCRIFLRGGSRPVLTELVAAVLATQPDDHHTVRHGRTEFEIRANPDTGLADDFIGWPFTIEAESTEPGPALVEAVSLVLRAAWTRGLDAVAACDFEDELPDLGGITRYR